MKKLIVLFSIIMLIVSCTSKPSGQKQPARNVEFRAKKMWFSATTYKYYTDHAVEIISVDSAYRVGDTIDVITDVLNDDKTYILLERVK